jgi:hypothetical protein
MNTKRVNSQNEIDDAQICYWKEGNIWYLYLPGAGVGALSKHNIVENPDGTITVSPSILMEGHLGKKHGFLENGIWRDA